MACSIHELAPAKLNLSLRVLQKRGDGFHDIESIFQNICLFDELTVSLSGACGCAVKVCGMDLPQDNTVTKAYAGFAELTGITQGVEVNLVKRIPSGAGMGGGSSDAATMLKALDALFATNLPKQKLVRLAESVGSDVPFFLSGDCAVVSGRGECIRPIKARKDLSFVIICPDVHSSTKEAYALVDEWASVHAESKVKWPPLGELEGVYRNPLRAWSFANSFTEPLAARHPQIAEALAAVADSGAGFANMTGSGSTVFGVFDAGKKAQDAYNRLASRWSRCYLCNAL